MRNFKPKRFSKFKTLFRLDHGYGQPDYFLISLVAIIALFGLLMLSSASSVLAFKKFDNVYYYFFHQLVSGFLLGLAAFLFLAKYDYRKLEKHSIKFFIAALLLLVAVFIPGLGADFGSANSWVNLGLFAFQPSEVAKLLLILSLAGWLAYRGPAMTKDFWNGLVPFLIFLGLAAVPIMLQPDIGTLLIIAIILGSMYFVAGARWTHLVGLLLAGAGGLGLVIVTAPYRLERLLTFLHPDLNQSGAGYQINQAFLAIGSGGWFGVGLGQSRQKFSYLPEVMGDSIFAVIAEEWGFIISALLVVAFLILAWRGLRLAKRVNDDYGKLVAVGIVSWFVVQAFINISAMIGLAPLTGIPLPFISYGGTALAISLAAVGILVSISRSAAHH